MRYQPNPRMAPNGHTDIIAKLESASGPDRELDAEIEVALFGGEAIWGVSRFTGDPTVAIRRPSSNHHGGFANEHCRPSTYSIDAALALVAEKLPGWRVAINSDDHRGPEWAAAIKPHGAHWPVMTLARSPALAVLLALFRALSGCEGHGTEQSSGAGQASGSAPNHPSRTPSTNKADL